MAAISGITHYSYLQLNTLPCSGLKATDFLFFKELERFDGEVLNHKSSHIYIL